MKSASDSISPVDNYVWTFTNKGRHSTKNAAILVLLISCSSAVTLIVMYKHSKWHVLLCQRLTNSVSKSLLFSTMFQSWMWFMYLYGHQIKGLSVLKDFLHSRSAVVSTAYMPFVDIGYYAFGIMGVLYLVEFPSLKVVTGPSSIGCWVLSWTNSDCIISHVCTQPQGFLHNSTNSSK